MNELTTVPDARISFADSAGFEHMQRVARALSESQLVPTAFQKNIPNCIIALEMAQRMNASPFAVMQQIYIVHGKPSWSAQFIIACINSCGRFSPLRFEVIGDGDDSVCFAWAHDSVTGDKLEGPPASIAMAKKEGWFQKNGSKWQTMPDLMLRYRAATFFGRLYAPELMMGMRTSDELDDIQKIKSANARTITPPSFLGEETPAPDAEDGAGVGPGDSLDEAL
jgi:hypothetical protein